MGEPQTEEDVTSPGKILKKYGNQPWWVLVIIAAVPSLTTSYFSYRTSVMETRAKTVENEKKAEAGFEELVKAVNLLQAHDEAKAKLDVETAKSLAGALAAINAIEMMMGTPHTHLDRPSLHVETPRNPKFPPSSPPPPPAAAAATASPRIQLSKSLDEAAKK